MLLEAVAKLAEVSAAVAVFSLLRRDRLPVALCGDLGLGTRDQVVFYNRLMGRGALGGCGRRDAERVPCALAARRGVVAPRPDRHAAARGGSGQPGAPAASTVPRGGGGEGGAHGGEWAGGGAPLSHIIRGAGTPLLVHPHPPPHLA